MGEYPAQENVSHLRLPPHSIEAERAVIGGILVDAEGMEKVAGYLLSSDFYRREHKLIFEAAEMLFNNQSNVDLVTVSEQLDRQGKLIDAGGIDYLGEVSASSTGSSNIMAYANAVKERAVLRGLIAAGNGIIDSCFNVGDKTVPEVLGEAQQRIAEISEGAIKDDHIEEFSTATHKLSESLDEHLHRDGSLLGITTGLDELDSKILGLIKTDLIIVAGRPSMGKTSAAQIMMTSAAKEGHMVVFFSMEMPREHIMARLYSDLANIPIALLREPKKMNDDLWNRYTEAVNKYQHLPLYIDDSSHISPAQARARVRKIERESGKKVGLIVFDYLQLMRPNKPNYSQEAEVADISRNLKVMGKDFNCPVVALSQLNRGLEQRADKRPRMSDLRQSGALEQDADTIIFVYRDVIYDENSKDKGIAELIIGKQRNGTIGTIRVGDELHYCRFKNLTSRPLENIDNDSSEEGFNY